MVNIHVSDPHVEVTDAHGKVVTSQTDPYWMEPNVMSRDRFKVNLHGTRFQMYTISGCDDEDVDTMLGSAHKVYSSQFLAVLLKLFG